MLPHVALVIVINKQLPSGFVNINHVIFHNAWQHWYETSNLDISPKIPKVNENLTNNIVNLSYMYHEVFSLPFHLEPSKNSRQLMFLKSDLQEQPIGCFSIHGIYKKLSFVFGFQYDRSKTSSSASSSTSFPTAMLPFSAKGSSCNVQSDWI